METCRSATWRNTLLTAFALLYRSSHLDTSSGETRLLERSMYPFSLSTRKTIATYGVETSRVASVRDNTTIHVSINQTSQEP